MRRCVLVLLLSVLATGCGVGLGEREPEPSGPWSLDGEPVSTKQVESNAGPEHCGWQEAHFLGLSWPPGRTYDDPRRLRTYAKDPSGVLDTAPRLRADYQADTALPGDAVDTGYRNDGYALWYSPSAGDSRVFLVREGTVESWPEAGALLGCA